MVRLGQIALGPCVELFLSIILLPQQSHRVKSHSVKQCPVKGRKHIACVCVCNPCSPWKTSTDMGASLEGFLLTPERGQACAEEPRG